MRPKGHILKQLSQAFEWCGTGWPTNVGMLTIRHSGVPASRCGHMESCEALPSLPSHFCDRFEVQSKSCTGRSRTRARTANGGEGLAAYSTGIPGIPPSVVQRVPGCAVIFRECPWMSITKTPSPHRADSFCPFLSVFLLAPIFENSAPRTPYLSPSSPSGPPHQAWMHCRLAAAHSFELLPAIPCRPRCQFVWALCCWCCACWAHPLVSNSPADLRL